MSDAIFWFRRDLRIHDNAGLYHALQENSSVRLLFIFDRTILDPLPDRSDPRVFFIHEELYRLKRQLKGLRSDIEIHHGRPEDVFRRLLARGGIRAVYTNHDDEPAARRRDGAVAGLCREKGVEFRTFKDHVIFERDEVLSQSLQPFRVYTPYKKKWLDSLSPFYLKSYPTGKYLGSLKPVAEGLAMPSLADLGFQAPRDFAIPPREIPDPVLRAYEKSRDLPALAGGTSRIGLHLRFGTVSVRDLVRRARSESAVWLSELIWREFFMQVLFHFPHVETKSFRSEFDRVPWREDRGEFERWREGMTGYPFVDAGLRELNRTGFMHNRARMVTASFLTKHLLMHWSKGERHFAERLLDFEFASNNGNWQWAAGTGCDAAPYFRIFNPESQQRRFDPDFAYVRKWVPEWGTSKYPEPMVDHKFARERALETFKKTLKGERS